MLDVFVPQTMKPSDNLLMVADSERDANMLYAVGLFVPDPFIYLRLRGRQYIVMSDLEVDRARRTAPHCRVLSLGKYQERLRRAGIKSPGLAQVVREILRAKGVRRVLAPSSFPLGLATELGRLRISVRTRAGNVFPQREQKSPAEVKRISAALVMAEVGMAEGMQVLRAARISRDRRLIHNSIPLTSEKLRSVIDTAVLQASGLPAHTIVAGGRQGCDPHERGFGPLRADEPIIIDIFPRSQQTGYSATSPAPSCAGGRAKACGGFTTRCCAGRGWRSAKSTLGSRPAKSIARSRNSLCSTGTRPANATGGWKDSFTVRATGLGWRFTKRRAWAAIPRANSSAAMS